MTGCKKIALMFVLGMSTAILGAACSTTVDEPTPAPQRLAEAVAAMSPPDLAADHHHGWEERERCHRRCEERRDECFHHEGDFGGGGHEEHRRRCERESRDCFERCDHE